MIAIFLICTTAISAQTYHAPKKVKPIADTTTTFKYEVNDSIYNIYKSKNDTYYIWRKSKKGKIYKYYLPKEVQERIFFDEIKIKNDNAANTRKRK